MPRRRFLASAAIVLATGLAGYGITAKLPAMLHSGQSTSESSTVSMPSTAPVLPLTTPLGIDYRDFRGHEGMVLSGTAVPLDAAIRLTGGEDQFGSAWSAFPIDLSRSFRSAFRVNSLGHSGLVTFFLQGAPEALDPSYTVMFDFSAGTVEAMGTPAVPYDFTEDGLTGWLDYSASAHTLTVSVSPGTARPALPLLVAGVDLGAKLHDGPGFAGFAGATPDRAGAHDLLVWHFASVD